MAEPWSKLKEYGDKEEKYSKEEALKYAKQLAKEGKYLDAADVAARAGELRKAMDYALQAYSTKPLVEVDLGKVFAKLAEMFKKRKKEGPH
jgi:hypothetical protein